MAAPSPLRAGRLRRLRPALTGLGSALGHLWAPQGRLEEAGRVSGLWGDRHGCGEGVLGAGTAPGAGGGKEFCEWV